jgi:very-short-patch-repair endonuclease
MERLLQEHFRQHHGVVARSEVLALGGSDSLIRSRVGNGTWVRRHPGVYILAAAPRTPTQEVLAALAAVPGSVVSYDSAAWLLGLLEESPETTHVTAPTQGYWLHGVKVHRSKVPPATVRIQGLPCTTATRTLVDLAATADAKVLTEAVDRALQRKLTAVPRLELALATTERGRPGAGALRTQLLRRGMTGTPEPSALESRMDRLLARSGLPPATPQLEVSGGRYRLDYAWPEARLGVEVKGYAWHSSPEAAQADAERERHLARERWTLLSFTWTDVTRRPAQVLAEIEHAYASSFSARRNNSRGKDAACG